MTSNPAELLITEQMGSVRRLTLNRADKRNALSKELEALLFAQIDDAGRDSGTSVILLRAAGDCFSTGADLSGWDPHKTGDVVQRTPPMEDQSITADTVSLTRFWTCPIPIIAAVQGWCLGRAVDIVQMCDLTIAAKDARFGHPGVRSGTPTNVHWIYHTSPQIAKWLLFTGSTISGEAAARHGLALTAVDAADLDDFALAAANNVALLGRDLLIANKAILNLGIDLMGRSVLQRFAGAQDAIAHGSRETAAFKQRIAEVGLREANAERNARFNDAAVDIGLQ
jgi:enoyl-CoA hydratase